jgi:hypothetical protein
MLNMRQLPLTNALIYARKKRTAIPTLDRVLLFFFNQKWCFPKKYRDA